MPLVASSRHTAADLQYWYEAERRDAIHAERISRKIDNALQAVEGFLSEGPAYVSVSWGKDSVTTAHLTLTVAPETPLLWVRDEGWDNPECVATRDAFLCLHPEARYEERITRRGDRAWPSAEELRQLVGAERRITGIRADESADRRMRWRAFGYATRITCAPLSLWTTSDVFAYLYLMSLPVNPVYAMTFGGRLRREELRVDGFCPWWPNRRGDERGRNLWERHYFPEFYRKLEAEQAQDARRNDA